MSLPRSSAKPVSCRIGAGITEAHANKHYAVQLGGAANDIYEHPTVALVPNSAANELVTGELLNVDLATGECSVLFDGIMYLRASTAYAASMNGFRCVGVAAGDAGEVTAGAAGIARGPIIEGGGEVEIDGAMVDVVRARGY